MNNLFMHPNNVEEKQKSKNYYVEKKVKSQDQGTSIWLGFQIDRDKIQLLVLKSKEIAKTLRLCLTNDLSF